MTPTFVYAQLNARLMPIERGERFEDPLLEAFEANELGEVTGGGTLQAANGEIEYCGLDIDVYDLAKAVRFLTKFLTKCGAPKGSMLQYEKKGKPVETPFGEAEGLALYLNGTDLPKKVYKECDINDLYEELNRLLGKHGRIEGHWQGPSETALYLYGKSAKKMQSLISDHIAAYPLCQKSRLVVIA